MWLRFLGKINGGMQKRVELAAHCAVRTWKDNGGCILHTVHISFGISYGCKSSFGANK